ncbi:unnamed protein product [Cyprideis torosa]|uniref:Uncharacterized protein n=1 Tax=Cyprideis torosa TaxID=163714 RepID=A0A7R8WQG3_9CRUS|nr:unnamed protein product [Cyprideis torosa]CAG0907743.1 unnamed protein product [Cyprideis torosa]
MQSKREDKKAAVLFIDLDDFKKINDTLGHDVGDQLLIQVAQRLRQDTREMDTVGRLGGDEFLLLLEGVSSSEVAGGVASYVIGELEKPFVVQGRELLLSASIGISMYPDDGTVPHDLLRKADTAMYSAKKGGRAGYVFFSPQLNDRVSRHFQVEEQLRGALARNEFRLVYQPQVNIQGQKMVGVEALLRWHNEVLGDVSPAEFIPIAERSGVIVPIGRYVIETAFQEMKTWCRDRVNPFTLSINLSPRQFRDKHLGEFLLSSLKKHGVPPDRLEVEITEGLFLDLHDGVTHCLENLNKQGVRLAIDDFGTGYSSLSCLRNHPFDTIKIDKEFVQGIAVDESDYELVFAVISMAHGLGLKVIAEGVETRDQHDLLEYHGCDVAQGFLYARPVPAKALKRAADQLPALFHYLTVDPVFDELN